MSERPAPPAVEEIEQGMARPRVWALDSVSTAIDLPVVSAGPAVGAADGSMAPRCSTHVIAGPGLRLVAEALDLILLAAVAIALSYFMTPPWMERPEELGPMARIADAVAGGLSGSGEGPQAAALARDQAMAKARAWIQAVFLSVLLWPVLLAAGGIQRTPAMLLLGLRPVCLRSGHAPRHGCWFWRSLIRIVDALPLCFVAGLYAARRDPLGAGRFLAEQATATALVRSTPLSAELSSLGVPASAYGTSEAGYLIEALLERIPQLSPERGFALARRLADTIASAHPEEISPETRRLLDRNEPIRFLEALRRESATPDQ